MKADVLIVGGGILGCATAIELARKGKSAIIFEKDVPGRHASGNNSGGVRSLWGVTCEKFHLPLRPEKCGISTFPLSTQTEVLCIAAIASGGK